jgi:hypothetical protein
MHGSDRWPRKPTPAGWRYRLTDEEDQRLREQMTIDIDDTKNQFLAALLQQRA